MASLLLRALISAPALLLLAACAGDPSGELASTAQPTVAAGLPSTSAGGMPPRGLSSRPAVTVEALNESREVHRPTTLRDAPFAASNVLMPLHPGDEVKVTGRLQDGSWYRVVTADGEGWVRPTQLAQGSGVSKVAAVEQVRLAPGKPAALPVASRPQPIRATTKAPKRVVTAEPVKVPPKKVVAKPSMGGATKTAVKKPPAKPVGRETVQAPARKPSRIPPTASAASRASAS